MQGFCRSFLLITDRYAARLRSCLFTPRDVGLNPRGCRSGTGKHLFCPPEETTIGTAIACPALIAHFPLSRSLAITSGVLPSPQFLATDLEFDLRSENCIRFPAFFSPDELLDLTPRRVPLRCLYNTFFVGFLDFLPRCLIAISSISFEVVSLARDSHSSSLGSKTRTLSVFLERRVSLLPRIYSTPLAVRHIPSLTFPSS